MRVALMNPPLLLICPARGWSGGCPPPPPLPHLPARATGTRSGMPCAVVPLTLHSFANSQQPKTARTITFTADDFHSRRFNYTKIGSPRKMHKDFRGINPHQLSRSLVRSSPIVALLGFGLFHVP